LLLLVALPTKCYLCLIVPFTSLAGFNRIMFRPFSSAGTFYLLLIYVMGQELSKVYEPKVVESRVNEIWFSGGYFHADTSADGQHRKPYTIVIPPPNVTAPLHIGHALNNTLQDILIRFNRMRQFNTLWLPGTDHAGIATQTVVEKRLLAEQGKKRTDFARDKFIAHVQAWKDEYEAMIISQLKAMGCSCDWQRTRFTMDETCAKAVRAAFFKLFKDGLIYRGKRLVNWDPATQTVLADDEVEYETVQGYFWYLRYPLVEPVKIGRKQIEYVTVATTRPETMLGDTAVAMNPSDARAKYLLGKKVRLPIVGRIIPIIADEHVVLPNPNSEDEKAKFSTGFLKVTPAHDPDDWEIGQRHNLPIINVMAPDASISDKHGWTDWEQIKNPDVENLIGMDRFEAREAIVEWFRKEGLLEEIKPYSHEVGHSYRSHIPIEPYLSDQWYIAVKKPISSLVARGSSLAEGFIEGTDVPVNSLAGLALKPLLDGRLRFIPDRYAKTYQTWLENLRDWPISRQLWWGHRIPVWYLPWEGPVAYGPSDSQIVRLTLPFLSSKENQRVVTQVIRERKDGLIFFGLCVEPGHPEIEEKLLENGAKRDEDVLDTWFSSALWPFSTMGWPDETPELKTFYPGNVLCTAREIITLWVSRMVMMGQYCAGNIPFRDVYIHAMIQDGEGRKMSKSLGNGIDPLTVIDSHGADAMRFTLASMTTQTQDIRMPVVQMTLPDGRTANTSPKFDIGRNFCNKLWNASRFTLMNLEDIEPDKFDKDKMTITDKWILSRLAQTITDVTDALDEYKYSEPLSGLYKFFWNDFCDWYLEWIKPRMQDKQQKPIAQNVLAFVLDQTLRLLHPFVPFITEGIFQKLNGISPVRRLEGMAEAKNSEALVVAEWPKSLNSLRDADAEKQIAIVQDTVRTIRDIRSKYNTLPSEMLKASAKSQWEISDILNRNAELIKQLAGLKGFQATTTITKPSGAAVAVVNAMEVYVHDMIDTQAERRRLEKQKQRLEQAKKTAETKLTNKNFLQKAKPQVVTQAKDRLAQLSKELETVEKHLAELENSG
jgi:valyl-tRNA synthetase